MENEKQLFNEQNITETLLNNYMPYSMSVIISRAIPEIDGFKPSHRKLLYTMYKKGLLKGPRTKSANVVGETMKLNPHGDQAIYETMVRMTRGNATLLHPYVDSKGNFGKVYSRDTAYAAARYTEVKLEKISEELFCDLDKDAVDFVDNYDGTMKEPTLFPVTFPSILVNSNMGVAVGMATNICSFNLKEICDATCAFIDDNTVDLLEYIVAPDFSTGGTVIYSHKDMTEIIEKGRGSLKVRGKYRYDKKNSCIEIYEIPYTTSSEAIVDAIIDLVKKGKIKDITDVRDETDLEGLKIAIDIKKSVDPDLLMSKLYKMTPMQESFSCNFNVLINARPVVLGVRGLIAEWLNFRRVCVRRMLLNDIRIKEDRLHLLRGLEKIILDIDKAIKIIRETEKNEMVIPNLMIGFDIDEIQAEFIAEIKLRNINKEYIINKIDEKDALINEIAKLKKILSSQSGINNLIKEQLQEIAKKYGQERKTDVIHEDDVVVVTKDEFIEDNNIKLYLTRDGYLKKIPLTALRSSPEQKVKDGDEITQEIDWHNKSEIIIVSSKQTVYKMKIHDIPDCKASSFGEYLPNILGTDSDEKIISIIVTDNYEGFILYGFENGKVSQVPLKAYETKTNRKKLINAYGGASPLVGAVHVMSPDDEIAISSSNDRVVVLPVSLVPIKSTKSSHGVSVIKLKKGCTMKYIKKVADADFANPKVYKIKEIPAAGSFLKSSDN
ncbi:MAG: topoisomerase IV [Clostridia bacterium]|nr:topoisomerase IV [Clostridia bacterium]